MFFQNYYLERPRIKILSDQENDRFYIGEDAIITAYLENPENILCATWHKETPYGDQALDLALPKYKETANSLNEQILRIKNCCEGDRGIYFLLAGCSCNTEICSNRICLKIVEGYNFACLYYLSFESIHIYFLKYACLKASFIYSFNVF